MPAPLRLFVDAPLAAGATIPGSAGQAHYLGSVMRRGVGDLVLLFNEGAGEWAARIALLRRDQARFIVLHRTREPVPEPGPCLLFALLKRDATDLLVRQATEMGAASLRPVITARTNAARVNTVRLATIAVEASEQSERLSVPILHPPMPLDRALADWPAARTLAVAAERRAGAAARADALLVGPEGGFAPAELDALLARPFVVPISLGPRILRAETAAIAGLALLQAPFRNS